MKISQRAGKDYMKEALNVAIGSSLPKFHVALFQAFLKADSENLAKLTAAFPEEAALFNRWKQFGMDTSSNEIVI